MIALFEALAPIFILIGIGYWVRRTDLLAETFWLGLGKLTFHVFFPALLLVTTAKADLKDAAVPSMAGAQILALASVILLSISVKLFVHVDGPKFTSILQGVIRPNTYVGLAASGSLFGPSGLALAAMCVAVIVPLVNFVSVIALFVWGRNQHPTLRGFLMPVIRNPLVMSCLAGIGFNLVGLSDPPLIGPVLNILGQAALPSGLLAVGAAVDLRSIRDAGLSVFASSACKLLLVPALTFVMCNIVGLDGTPATIIVFFSALPAAPASYVMARLMGGDAHLMASILTFQTVAAFITLPFVLAMNSWLRLG